MAIVFLSGNKITGTSGDVKPTLVATNSTLLETDTNVTFQYNGSAWVQLDVGVGDTISNTELEGNISLSKLANGTAGKLVGYNSGTGVIEEQDAPSSGEFGSVTTPTTINPSVQTGTIEVMVDNTTLTIGSTDVKVDGVTTNVGATTVLDRIFSPSTSLQIIAKGIPYDMNNASFNDQYAFSGCYDMSWKSDGTVAYLKQTNNIYEIRLTTAWDLTTASTTSTNLNVGIMGSGGGVSLSDDGTKLTACPLEGGSMRTYTFSTAWDITTSTGYVSQSNPLGTGLVRGMSWINSGNKLLVNRDNTYETHSASTAYDITTLSDDNNDFSTSAQTGSKRGGIDMSADGKIIIVGTQGTPYKIYKYDLSTAWDISTSVYATQALDYQSQTSTCSGCAFGELDNKLIIAYSYNRLFEYDVPDSFSGESNYKVI
jgi:hypothetical protein